MSKVFLKLLNLSITASWLILAVVIIRPLLKKTPKWINCALWALVALRLVCPFSFESALSLIPSSETIPYDIAMQNTPTIDTGISGVNQVINPMIANNFTPDPLTSANPLQILIPVVSVLWLVGMAALLLYALISYLRLKKSVGASIAIKDNIMACDDVKSPFILGIMKPVIYVPSSMTGETLDCVINHETAHIKRHDHWWKPLGYLLLTVYWFNPLCWLAYVLLCRDIEMACDEKVIRDMDRNEKAAYSQALLNCNFPRKRIAACPLAFGEVGVKERVKSVLNYKKPAFWIIIVAVIACVAVAVCFLTNPKRDSFEVTIVVPAHGQNQFYYSEEQISPSRNRIILNAGANIVDTEVVLKTIEVKEENSYEPVYLTHGMPVKMDVEKGAWFSVGVYMDNPTDEDIIVSVIVDNVSVRIADEHGVNRWDCSVTCVEESTPDHYVITYSDAEVSSQTGTLTFQNRNDFDIVVHILQEGETEVVSDKIPAGGCYSFLRMNDKPCTIGVHADVAVNTEIKLFVYDGAWSEPYIVNNINGSLQIVYVDEIPENVFTAQIPKPANGTIDYVIDDSSLGRYALFFKDITMEQSEAYIEELKSAGYKNVAGTKEDVAIGVMLQKDDVTLSVACSDEGLGIQIIFANPESFSGNVSVVGGVDGPKAVKIKTNGTYYNLTEQGKLQVTGSIDSNHSFVQSQMLWTNSTKISIKNNSGTDVTAYLFSAENESAPILEMTLSNKEEKAFTNLSSQYVYFMRIEADSSANVSVSISD